MLRKETLCVLSTRYNGEQTSPAAVVAATCDALHMLPLISCKSCCCFCNIVVVVFYLYFFCFCFFFAAMRHITAQKCLQNIHIAHLNMQICVCMYACRCVYICMQLWHTHRPRCICSPLNALQVCKCFLFMAVLSICS